VCASEWDCTVIDDATVRLGLCVVNGLRKEHGAHLLLERMQAPFASVADFNLRTKLTKAEQDQVVDECFQCKLCYINCPYVPGQHEWAIDFPRLMLRAEAMRSLASTFADAACEVVHLVNDLDGQPGCPQLNRPELHSSEGPPVASPQGHERPVEMFEQRHHDTPAGAERLPQFTDGGGTMLSDKRPHARGCLGQ